MYFLAQAVAEESTKSFAIFDLFMVLFTLIIAVSVFRLARMKKKNLFALGFTTIGLLTFLAVDFLMVLSWFGYLKDFQDMIFAS